MKQKLTMLTPQFIEDYNGSIQQELFALPIFPDKVATLYGMELYSSESLRKKYINAMYKISKVKSIAPDIERLVNQGKIVPCWINKGMFRLAMFKFMAPRSETGTLGFFTPKTQQIFLLMDNNISFGFANDKVLADLMIHEMMHMAANKFKNVFVKQTWNIVLNYYKAAFGYIFKAENIENECKLIIRFLFKNFEFNTKGDISKFYEKYLTLVSSSFRKKSELKEDEFSEHLTNFYHFIKLYHYDKEGLFKQLRKFEHIRRGLYKGYEDGLRVKNNMSFCVQELFFPSEVVCMYIELYKGKVPNLYSMIKKL